jgi:hypothetical protein
MCKIDLMIFGSRKTSEFKMSENLTLSGAPAARRPAPAGPPRHPNITVNVKRHKFPGSAPWRPVNPGLSEQLRLEPPSLQVWLSLPVSLRLRRRASESLAQAQAASESLAFKFSRAQAAALAVRLLRA